MDGPLFMDAVITANRSLSARGFVILIGALTTINAASAAVFVFLGAGPVPIFIGLDLAAVIIAFAISIRAARRRERIQVSAAEVRVLLETPRGEQMVWASPTAFTQVALIGEAEDRTDLRLRLSGREFPVARALSRRERLSFSRALDAAIVQARSGRMIG
ncbi:MAG: DUF2244 domain-containing protein [Caulobacteraceae bacterium]